MQASKLARYNTRTMSLTTTDLGAIRSIVKEEVRTEVKTEMSLQLGPVNGRLRDIDDRLMSVEGRLEAVENDVKEIHFILSGEPANPLDQGNP